MLEEYKVWLLLVEQSHLKHFIKEYIASGEKLFRFLKERSVPFDGAYGKSYMQKIVAQTKLKFQNVQPEDDKTAVDALKDMNAEIEVEKRKRQGRWKMVEYNKEAALSYFMGTKAAYDFACLKTILLEIFFRAPDFAPKSLLDFGSGVGTVSW